MRRQLDTVLEDRTLTRAFLNALAGDVCAAGGAASVHTRRGRISFRAEIDMDSESLMAATDAMSRARRQDRRALLARAADNRLHERFTSGRNIDPTCITPRVLVCESRAEHDIFSFVKLRQSVPSAPRAGRRIRLLVMDEGQSHDALIGVVEVASPVYRLACRDDAFRWTGGSEEVRVSGLRRVMDMATCLALPPYSSLRAGKLLAMLAVSDLVADRFQSRYSDRLAAIVATCATGLHYPHLNRLNVVPGGLYRRVGATAGYSTWMFRPSTLAAARALVFDGRPAASFGPSDVTCLRFLRSAFRRCGLNEERLLRTTHPKGVYVCDVSGDGVASLRIGSEPQGSAMTADHCTDWWRERILPRALANAEKPWNKAA